MKFRLLSLAALMSTALASSAHAQSKYDQFIGQYMASTLIASHCSRLNSVSPDGAADMAKSLDRLRKQKVLRLLYYSKTTSLNALGRHALLNRGINAGNAKQLCQFGEKISGKPDAIGRFLTAQ